MEASSEADMPCKEMKTATRGSGQQLADNVLFMEVLTRLPAKTLSRFKQVSRLWRNTISTDRFFALQQSRRQTCISSAVVYRCPVRRSLAFLPTCEGRVAVPDPFLGFPHAENFRILASVHGLLLLHVDLTSDQLLYICNPVTGEGMRIPGGMRGDRFSSFGLAFDPWASPDRYTVVYAQRSFDNKYNFEIFSSSTGQWTKSSAVAEEVRSELMPNKAIFLEGVIYWHSKEYILSYDTLDDATRVLMVPQIGSMHSIDDLGGWENHVDEIGVWEKSLAYSQSTSEMVRVWVTRKEMREWEMKHRIQLDRVDLLCSGLYSKMWWVWRVVLPGEGEKNIIYLRMKAYKRFGKWEAKEVIVKWDTAADEVAVLGEIESDWSSYPNAFSYHNGLVALPHFPQL